MSEWAIRVADLGKRYRMSARRRPHQTFREALARGLGAPFRSRRGGDGASAAGGDEDWIWALRDVSFEVAQGEIVGIIGRNGAGKSTLLKILSRITRPTVGRAEIRGRVGSLLEIGTGFHPELTGRDNVYLNGAILGMTRAEIREKFDEIVAFAGVEAFVDEPVKHYSSGMHLRLAFAVAAHLQPEILLLDEVLAVGDLEFQKKCVGRMEAVAGEGRTVLVVSHSVSMVTALCARAILLDRGTVKAIGPAPAVVAAYLSGARVDRAAKAVAEQDHDPRGGHDIRVRHVRLVNGPMESFSVFWRQPIAVALDVEVLKPVQDVSFGASLRLLDGTFVFIAYNDDGDRPRWRFDPGRYTVEVTLENIVRPGLYVLGVGAHQRYAQLRNLFNLNAVTIEVLDVSADGRVASTVNPGIVTGVGSEFAWSRTG